MNRVHLAIVAAAFAAGCNAAPPAPLNVILISVDTLRSDALGSYGGPAPTPNLDALAREGVRFETAIAPTPETAPSHGSLFTGRGVLEHGVLRNGASLGDAPQTLAEALHAAGYRTGAFVSSFVLDPRFGWSRGLDVYDARFDDSTSKVKRRALEESRSFWTLFDYAGFDRDAVDTTVAARRWLLDAPEPFFLFVHYFDPHDPYEPPPDAVSRVADLDVDVSQRASAGLGPIELQRLARDYLGEVVHVDDAVGELLSALKTRNARDHTLVVVTGDHGEGLGQHDWLHHAMLLYAEQVRVPLVFFAPGHVARGATIASPVRLKDVAPTIAALVGAPPLRDATGRSLARSVHRGVEPESQYVFGYRARRNSVSLASERYAIWDGPWHYLRSDDRPHELYDVVKDPLELRNVVGERAEVAASLERLLERHLAERPLPEQEQTLTPDARRALRALGYVE